MKAEQNNRQVRNPYKRQIAQFRKIRDEENVFGIEHYLRILLCSLQFVTIGLFLKYLFGKLAGFKGRKLGTEMYMMFNLIFPFSIITFKWYTSSFLCFLLIALLTETILYLLALIFLVDIISRTASYKRNFIGILCNYFQTVGTFAALYLHFGLEGLNNSRLGSVYFSLATQSTLGYGDVHPEIGDTINIILVIAQVIIGLLFIILFFTRVISLFDNKTFMNKIDNNKYRNNEQSI